MLRRSEKKQAMLGVARKLINSGIKTAIITMASQGCMVVQGDEIIRAYAPKVKAVDASGAGATFSSGFAYGYLNGWRSWRRLSVLPLRRLRSRLHVQGLKMFPVKQIQELARTIRIERMVYRGDQFHTIRKFLTIPQDTHGEQCLCERKPEIGSKNIAEEKSGT
jgi:fructose-1-phosphate kinase PfkB-like protein